MRARRSVTVDRSHGDCKGAHRGGEFVLGRGALARAGGGCAGRICGDGNEIGGWRLHAIPVTVRGAPAEQKENGPVVSTMETAPLFVFDE